MDVAKYIELAKQDMSFTDEEWSVIQRNITTQFKFKLNEHLTKTLWKDPKETFHLMSVIVFEEFLIDFSKVRYQPNILRIKKLVYNILEEKGWGCSNFRFSKNWMNTLRNIELDLEFSQKETPWYRILGKFLMICKLKIRGTL